MWSVWSKRVDIYLGRSVALVRLQGRPTMVIEHPSTWPLQRVLERIATAWQSTLEGDVAPNSKAKPKFGRANFQLHIALGSGRCESRTFVVPQGVHKYAELHSLALASAVQSGDRDATVCAIDPLNPGVMCSIGTRFFQDMNSWATSQTASVATLQPLWSIATQCALARRKNVAALALSEPDGITLLVGAANGAAASTSANLTTLRQDSYEEQVPGQTILMDKQLQLQLQRWKIANELQDDNVVSLVFGSALTSKSRSLPKTWGGHWSRA